MVVDDLHWSDQPSAQALLFALRRMQADRVLGLVSARPDELSRLGGAWSRFARGDDRATRLRLDGLGAPELVAMARALSVGDLSGRAVARLLDHTGGNSLHCRALLEELGRDGLARAGGDLPAPRALAAVVLARLGALSGPAQGLVTAAAVLGRRCPLAAAATLAGLAEPLTALDEAVAAGLVTEERAASQPLISPSPTRWCMPLSGTVSARPSTTGCIGPRPPWCPALPPSLTAWPPPSGPDDRLASDLEEAARDAAREGMAAQAAAWLAQASAASTAHADQERLLLDAVAALLGIADVPGALNPVACGRPVRSQRPAQRPARPPRPALRTGSGDRGPPARGLAVPQPRHRADGGSGRGHLLVRLPLHRRTAGGGRDLGRAGRRSQRRGRNRPPSGPDASSPDANPRRARSRRTGSARRAARRGRRRTAGAHRRSCHTGEVPADHR